LADLGANFVEVAEITTPVRFTALLTVDRYDRPTGGDITSVLVLEDDSGFAPWEALAAVDANGNQMVPALKDNGNVVFTKPFTRETRLSKEPYPQGTTGIVTRLHTGPLGGITHVDVRLEDGNFVRNVPVDFFRA